jgi:hypothetical protein
VKKRNVIETVTRYINGTRRIRGFESLGNSAEARKDTPLPLVTHIALAITVTMSGKTNYFPD